MNILWLHIYTAWLFFAFFLNPFAPIAIPFYFPFVLPFTYLAPSSCDRNCPPSYQVACRLTPFAPPFAQSTHPLQIPRTPIAQRLTTTTLGPLRSHYAEHSLPKVGGGGADLSLLMRSLMAASLSWVSGLRDRPRGSSPSPPPPTGFSPLSWVALLLTLLITLAFL